MTTLPTYLNVKDKNGNIYTILAQNTQDTLLRDNVKYGIAVNMRTEEEHNIEEFTKQEYYTIPVVLWDYYYFDTDDNFVIRLMQDRHMAITKTKQCHPVDCSYCQYFNDCEKDNYGI